ncbi:MAG: ArsR family transcriptional regulator [Planctomycetota bacterium]|nr:MAG: ArsR family transcriptional regulator [Planctomycetota bacterium]
MECKNHRPKAGLEIQGALRCCELGELLSPKLFKALSEPNRIQLLVALATTPGSCTVKEMSACCPVDGSVVSRHLSQMREAGIVRAEKKGKEVHYQANLPVLIQCLRDLADALDSCCPESSPSSAPTSDA